MKRLLWSLTLGGALLVSAGVNAQTLERVGSLTLPAYMLQVTVADSLLVVSCREAGVAIVNAADPEHPELLATVDTPSDANDAVVRDGHVFLADHSALRVIDLADPAAPELVEAFSDPTFGLVEVAQGEDNITVLSLDSRLLVVAPADTPHIHVETNYRIAGAT